MESFGLKDEKIHNSFQALFLKSIAAGFEWILETIFWSRIKGPQIRFIKESFFQCKITFGQFQLKLLPQEIQLRREIQDIRYLLLSKIRFGSEEIKIFEKRRKVCHWWWTRSFYHLHLYQGETFSFITSFIGVLKKLKVKLWITHKIPL